MPLVAAAVLVYVAGLLSGFANASMLPLVVAGAVAWRASARPRDRLALVSLAVAGLALGVSGHRARERCAASLVSSRDWQLELAQSAEPGAFVAARSPCGARASIAVEKGQAPEGALVDVAGTAVPTKVGILVTKASVRQVRAPGILSRWRAGIGAGIDRHFGTDAPLVRALLIADMSQLSPTLRQKFAAAGLSHMLSVSGLHVGLIAVAVGLVAEMARMSKRRSDAFVIILTAVYVLVIGAPLPAVRAAAMLAAVSLSVAIQRPTSAWAVLAVSAIIPLLNPGSAIDLGFQLSMVGMVALVASGFLPKRIPLLAAAGWRGSLLRGMATSVMATVLTTPLVAATFGTASIVAPLTNLVAVPVMAVLQPMLFLALLFLPLPALAHFVADACHPLITGVDWIAAVGAGLPGASIPIMADRTGMLLGTIAATAFVLAVVVRHAMRSVIVGMACVAILAWRPTGGRLTGMTELHMIDVGQGDAIALRTTAGNWVLFDAGRDWQSGDAGRRDIVPYIAEQGGSVVGFVLSHPHSDHVGGAASVIEALKPRWYRDPGFAGGTPSYRESLVAAREHAVQWDRARPGDSIVVDEATIVFLAPDSAWADALRDPNDASTVALVRVGNVRMLLTGDAEQAEEAWLLEHRAAQLDVDILKVAHHGSSTSSTARFLDAVTPRVALVSVGAGNVYRHPSAEVMRALALQGAIIMRTDRHGSVVVRTDGTRIEVESARESWSLP